MTARDDILEYVSEKENCPQNWLYEEIDVSRGRISQVLKEMEEEGLVKREKKGREKWIRLKSKGKDELNNILKDRVNSNSPTESTPKQSGLPGRSDGVEAIDFHNSVIRVRIENLEQLQEMYSDSYGDRWNIQYLEKKGVRYQENKYNNAVNYYEDGYEVILTQNYAFIRLEDVRSSPGDLFRNFQRVMVKGKEAIEWLEGELQEIEVDLESAEPCFEINEGHTALVEENLAQLVTEHPGADLNQFRIFIDGELRMWIDNSDGEAHLETRTDGQGIEDLHFIFNEIYRSFIDNKEGWRQVMDLAESSHDVSRLPKKISSVESAVERLSESVQNVTSSVKQVLEANNGGGFEVQSSIEEMEDRQSSSDQRIVEKLDELAEVQDISSKVENLENRVGEVEGSSQVTPVNTGRSVDEIRVELPETSQNLEKKSLKISTDRSSRRSEGGQVREGKEFQVDPSSLPEGLRFKDLRTSKLLEIYDVQLEETDEGFRDIIQVRIAGTLKIWHELPRRELARLLGTGRFSLEGMARRKNDTMVRNP